MNGIIHNCSHPNDGDAHFRLPEEQVFLGIFSYIEHLYSKIKPRKVFFMAIDGVAPRAKMNQQRSRRFRTAKEAKDLRDKALKKGEELPKDDPFDSNAITPGTPFMARLSAQLKWWVNKKVSEDADWRGVKVILSGHEVPGEGEHKIMEYIRLAKAQPEYNPNVRHCLYGLDADLIMLGLLSHDPHFCLLREEVTFGRTRGKKSGPGKLDQANFYLLHLSLFREYLDLEFQALATMPNIGFDYDLERVIDDFILLCMLIGNDFLPHLPGLHIQEGAMNLLFESYKRILPQAGGYLHDQGTINLPRFQLVLDELQGLEQTQFESEVADAGWFKGKAKSKQKQVEEMETAQKKGKLVLTKQQRELYDQVKTFLHDHLDAPSNDARLVIRTTLSVRDRHFLQNLADALHLALAFDEFDGEDPIIVVRFDQELLSLIAEHEDEENDDAAEEANGDGAEWVDTEGEETEDDAEWRHAIERLLKKYEKAPIKDVNDDDLEASARRKMDEKMHEWRMDYYRDKLEVTAPEDIRQVVFRYIEGLQWVLHYYYDGVASWAWFYDYHYAPKIHDLRNIDQFEFSFELGSPFKPFEQLMGVLPDLSSSLIPEAYRDLMTDPESPIISFYPRDFEADMNGKKAEWEAVVKIPFIDEKRLLKTMYSREPRLTAEERRRNVFGDSWQFVYDEEADEHVASSLPGFFPDLHHCKSRMNAFELPTLSGRKLVKGLCEGVLLGKDAIAGFPSLYTLPNTGNLGFHSVNVFQADSRNESMVLTIDNAFEGVKSEDLARTLVGTTAYYGWPFLQEGKVVAISDSLFRYELDAKGRVFPRPHSPQDLKDFHKTAERIEQYYSRRCGVITNDVHVLVHLRLVRGLKQLDDGSLVKEYDSKDVDAAAQTLVQTVRSTDERLTERAARPVTEDYPLDSKIFLLSTVAYGSPAIIIGHHESDQTVATKAMLFEGEKVDNFAFKSIVAMQGHQQYIPSHLVTRRVKMSALTLAKISSALMMQIADNQRINAGLNIKFESKSQKVLGYTRKTDAGWEYSEKAVQLIQEYKTAFPEIITTLDSKAKNRDVIDLADFFPSLAGNKTALEVKADEVKAWIKEKGVRDFDKVPLYSDQLEAETVIRIERYADTIAARVRDPTQARQVAFTHLPRKALLRPDQAANRLQHQSFALGDRVTNVDETGNVPLAAKGVVVGINVGLLDVIFDFAFMAGTTLGGRCSQYRGMSVAPASLLNLSLPQFSVATRPPPGSEAPARGGSVNGRGGSTRGLFNARAGPVRPAPSLPAHPNGQFQGDYRGVATGSSSGYAGAPPSHSIRSAIMGNGPPRSANLHAVPPPADMDAPRRGRGGGMARGRGRGAVNAVAHQLGSVQISQPAQSEPAVQRPRSPPAPANGPAPETLPTPSADGKKKKRGRKAKTAVGADVE